MCLVTFYVNDLFSHFEVGSLVVLLEIVLGQRSGVGEGGAAPQLSKFFGNRSIEES